MDSSRVAAAQRVAQHKASTPHTYTSSSCALDRVFELGYSDHHHLTAFLVKAAALTVEVREALTSDINDGVHLGLYNNHEFEELVLISWLNC